MANILNEIYSGWKNLAFENPEIEEEAKKRIEICVDCDSFLKSVKVCDKCGCYMPAKARSPISICPINKWGQIIVK